MRELNNIIYNQIRIMVFYKVFQIFIIMRELNHMIYNQIRIMVFYKVFQSFIIMRELNNIIYNQIRIMIFYSISEFLFSTKNAVFDQGLNHTAFVLVK